ncbi:Imm49 family immunity protein [Archangium lansingense]|uniref:Imm49 family immunity protein n=1 Tax=Archangium lansingense TaxID=2995310 RepID=A0ABT4APL2_9BACT|nr:Imm49 family immunity protein [Archangium lansinium]MCY1083623.1 Imm49 family immunity protein [Archangium lansinium]
MSSKFLQVFVSNARFDNAELLKAMASKASLQQVLTFCENYRIRGIGQFLLYGDAEGLHECLYKSGRAYLSLMGKLSESQLVTSRMAPFFDALAALDLDGAAEIARRSRRTWHQGMEYKEDFLYAHFLMGRFFLGETEARLQVLLEEYEQVLQGSEDVRLPLCHAFLKQDAEGVAQGLEQYLAAEKARQDRLLEREKISQERWATVAQVSVEGLGLLTLAAQAGLPLQREFPCVPSLARARRKPGLADDAWRDLDKG